MQTIYNGYLSVRTPPENLKPEDEKLFQHEFKKEISDTTLLQLHNATIFNDLIFDTGEKRFLFNYSYVHQPALKSWIKIFLSLFSRQEKIKIKAVWITDDWSTAYFHWLTDALTKLVAAEEFIDNSVVILPKNFKKYPFIIQSLQILNREVLFYNGKLKVKELFLPSRTAPAGNYNKAYISALRERFLNGKNLLPFRNVFISRQKAEKRKIVNEDEVTIVLKAYGYEVHFFEDYTLQQQIDIMSQTKFLIGLHGAGLTNMLFMPAGGQIMELRNKEDAFNNCYYSLASELSHKYYYLLNNSDTANANSADIVVNLSELKSNLDTIRKDL